MKKIIIMIIAIALLGMTGCTKKEDVKPSINKYTIQFTIGVPYDSLNFGFHGSSSIFYVNMKKSGTYHETRNDTIIQGNAGDELSFSQDLRDSIYSIVSIGGNVNIVWDYDTTYYNGTIPILRSRIMFRLK